MLRQTIAIDIDDVIANSTESLRRVVNTRLGINLTPEHYKIGGEYWGYYERVWASHGLGGKVPMNELNDEMIIDQSHVPLLPDVSFAIGELAKRYDIVIVTARDPAWEKATLRWLNEHFGNVFSSVHFAGHRHIDSAKTKGELCREINASLLIDDNIAHCMSAVEQGLDAILFGDYGWHQEVPKELQRCKDWPAVLEYFNDRA